MARLTTTTRKQVPRDEFGLPAVKKYPMPDKRHAANAKARASQQEASGHLSASDKARVDKKADRILGEQRS